MTDTDLATALAVPRSTISKWRTLGMPSSSIDAARAWQQANRPHRGRPTQPDAAPLTHPNLSNPDDLADDPYAVRDRLRKSEKQISCALDDWTEAGLPNAIKARDCAKAADEILAAENQISTIHLTIKDLRREHRQACAALLNCEAAIVKLEVARGKLIDLDVARGLLHASIFPMVSFLKKLPESAESDYERSKLTALAEAGLALVRESAMVHVRQVNRTSEV